jgi:hypothetical protein
MVGKTSGQRSCIHTYLMKILTGHWTLSTGLVTTRKRIRDNVIVENKQVLKNCSKACQRSGYKLK